MLEGAVVYAVVSVATDISHLNLIGESTEFRRALELVRRFSVSTATVLIQGETGTGKELAARAIHYLSERQNGPFIPINCGALPETLVESELFGHVRGAFTDAREATAGQIGLARGGTLFLDEIEAMPLRAQIVLLRFLQDKKYRAVGGSVVENADVRIVGATNADLTAMVKEGTFRSDLLFRLNVLPVTLPPLRNREGDVPVLARCFLARLNRQSDGPPIALDEAALGLLRAHSWPGNVRELENVMQRQFLLSRGGTILQLCAADLGLDADKLDGNPPSGGEALNEVFKIAKAEAVARFERAYIEELLSRTAGNLSLASRLSGKDRSDIGKLLRKHGISRHRFTEA
jgi:transcriptional regulator with PAS, ATPase and Fis domain